MKSSNRSATLELIALNILCYLPFTLLQVDVANTWDYTIGHFQLWRLITSMFAHSGVLHIGMNMIYLFILGSTVEAEFDNKLVYVADYLICGVGAGFISILIRHNISIVGASSAIYGLLGILLTSTNVKKEIIIVNFAFIALISISTPNVDVIGHIAGFLIGLAIGKLSRT